MGGTGRARPRAGHPVVDTPARPPRLLVSTRRREARVLLAVPQRVGRMWGPRGGLTVGQLRALDRTALQGQAEREGRSGQAQGREHILGRAPICPPSDLPALIYCPRTPNRLDDPRKHLQTVFLEPLSIRSGSELRRSLLTPPQDGPRSLGPQLAWGCWRAGRGGAELPRGPPPTDIRGHTVRVNHASSQSPGAQGSPGDAVSCAFLAAVSCLSLGLGPWDQGAFRPTLPASSCRLPGV